MWCTSPLQGLKISKCLTWTFAFFKQTSSNPSPPVFLQGFCPLPVVARLTVQIVMPIEHSAMLFKTCL